MSRRFVKEPFIQVPQTHADQLLGRVYNVNDVKLHPAPWPMERTDYDLQMLKYWEIWNQPQNYWGMYPAQGPTMQPYNSSL